MIVKMFSLTLTRKTIVWAGQGRAAVFLVICKEQRANSREQIAEKLPQKNSNSTIALE
jgi:hypothetical protein